jgi:hypothetical protein
VEEKCIPRHAYRININTHEGNTYDGENDDLLMKNVHGSAGKQGGREGGGNTVLLPPPPRLWTYLVFTDDLLGFYSISDTNLLRFDHGLGNTKVSLCRSIQRGYLV